MTAPNSKKSDDTLTGTDIIPAEEDDYDRVQYVDSPENSEFPEGSETQRFQEEIAKDMFRSRSDLLPQPVTGTIDVAKFLTAQAEYIKAQTIFMQSRRRSPEPPNTEEVLREVTRFSYAQADFIEAQSEVLKQLGVI